MSNAIKVKLKKILKDGKWVWVIILSVFVVAIIISLNILSNAQYVNDIREFLK